MKGKNIVPPCYNWVKWQRVCQTKMFICLVRNLLVILSTSRLVGWLIHWGKGKEAKTISEIREI